MRLHVQTIYLVFSLFEALPSLCKRMMADGGSQTHQASRSSQDDPWRQQGNQLEKVAQGQAYIFEADCWRQGTWW